MWTFIITPIVSLLCTILFTFIDLLVRKTRAPIFELPFDKKKETTGAGGGAGEGGKNVENFNEDAEEEML